MQLAPNTLHYQIDADATAEVLLSLFLPSLRLDARGIKAQYNEGGGGAFPIHTDSEEGLDGRKVRCSLYLYTLTPQLLYINQTQITRTRSAPFRCAFNHITARSLYIYMQVTCIFYLNDSWRPDHGGLLRLYPFPASPPVDVEPIAGRMVLFSSTQMHHRWAG
jgi:hypothetical protein